MNRSSSFFQFSWLLFGVNLFSDFIDFLCLVLVFYSAAQPPPHPPFAPPVGGKVSVSRFGEISHCSVSRCVSDVRAVFLTSQRNFDENTRFLSWGAKNYLFDKVMRQLLLEFWNLLLLQFLATSLRLRTIWLSGNWQDLFCLLLS